MIYYTFIDTGCHLMQSPQSILISGTFFRSGWCCAVAGKSVHHHHHHSAWQRKAGSRLTSSHLIIIQRNTNRTFPSIWAHSLLPRFGISTQLRGSSLPGTLLYLCPFFLPSLGQNRSFSWTPFGRHERCGGVLMMCSVASSTDEFHLDGARGVVEWWWWDRCILALLLHHSKSS